MSRQKNTNARIEKENRNISKSFRISRVTQDSIDVIKNSFNSKSVLLSESDIIKMTIEYYYRYSGFQYK